VLPVQTEAGNAGHYLATGDVVTVLPHALTPGTTTPRPLASSLVVRNAPTDVVVDSPNWYFAFAQPIPAACVDPVLTGSLALSLSQWDVVCAPGWSASDLTAAINPLLGWQRSLQPRGQMPRMDGWSSAWGAHGTDAAVWIASTDPTAPTPLSSDCTVDDLTAGGLTHAGVGIDGHESGGSPANTAMHGVIWFWASGHPSALLSASDPLTDVVVQTTTPLFSWGTGPSMGLVAIDGEVFAYQYPTAAEAAEISITAVAVQSSFPGMAGVTAQVVLSNGCFARLIGRALLSSGSGGIAHLIGSENLMECTDLPDGMPHNPLLTAIRLPVGPVRQLGVPVSATGSNPWFALHNHAAEPGVTPAARPLAMQLPRIIQ
jgi:hypothetical protein